MKKTISITFDDKLNNVDIAINGNSVVITINNSSPEYQEPLRPVSPDMATNESPLCATPIAKIGAEEECFADLVHCSPLLFSSSTGIRDVLRGKVVLSGSTSRVGGSLEGVTQPSLHSPRPPTATIICATTPKRAYLRRLSSDNLRNSHKKYIFAQKITKHGTQTYRQEK